MTEEHWSPKTQSNPIPLSLFLPNPWYLVPSHPLRHRSPIIPRHTHSRSPSLPLRVARAFPINSLSNNAESSAQFNQQLFRPSYPPQQPRTLFPGGYKRPELNVPTLVLQLDPDEFLSADTDALALIDKAVSKWVGIVVLASNQASGGKLYEAACSLKSLLQDRAYLLVAERVDIAAAAAASGVLLSDQGSLLYQIKYCIV